MGYTISNSLFMKRHAISHIHLDLVQNNLFLNNLSKHIVAQNNMSSKLFISVGGNDSFNL